MKKPRFCPYVPSIKTCLSCPLPECKGSGSHVTMKDNNIGDYIGMCDGEQGEEIKTATLCRTFAGKGRV